MSLVTASSIAPYVATGFVLPVIIFLIIAQWKVFTKAGQPGWTSIIPILSNVVTLKIVKRPLWWILLMLIPIVNVVVWIIVMVELAKAFGRGVGFAVGLIILPFIFMAILGFGVSEYELEPDPLF